MSRKNIPASICVECGTPDEDLDQFGQCFECADVLVPGEDDDVKVCYECGNDDGPYGGLCLDCLEALEEAGEEIDPPPPW